MRGLRDRRVILTGGPSGIGRAAAICMAKEGAKVWATDINAEALKTLAAEGIALELKTAD